MNYLSKKRYPKKEQEINLFFSQGSGSKFLFINEIEKENSLISKNTYSQIEKTIHWGKI